MALTPNPLVNAPSDRGDLSSMKLFQDFNGPINPTPGIAFSQSFSGNYIPYVGAANINFINNLFATAGVRNPGVTAVVCSLGNHQIFITADPGLPTTTLPSGTTKFVSAGFDSNCLLSSGNLAFP